MSGIDYGEALARSRPGMAFANSTEWECWSAHWCDRCLRDAPFRNGLTNVGCPLILVALQERIPAEWMEQPRDERGRYSLADQYHCIEFRAPGGGGGREPRPQPEPPDMDGLFPRPERRVRMLRGQPGEMPSVAEFCSSSSPDDPVPAPVALRRLRGREGRAVARTGAADRRTAPVLG